MNRIPSISGIRQSVTTTECSISCRWTKTSSARLWKDIFHSLRNWRSILSNDAHARRLGRGTHARDAGHHVCRRRRTRCHRGVRANASCRRDVSLDAQARVPPLAVRARVGPCRQRRGQRVPLTPRARQRGGSGSGAPHGAVAPRLGRARSSGVAGGDRARRRRGANALA